MTTAQEFKTQTSLVLHAKRIADALERIATVLEKDVHINIDHAHIDQIDHNHVEGKIHTKEDNW